MRPLVRVVDHLLRLPPYHRHGERLLDQFGPQMGLHRPAHDQAAPGVQDHGHIQPARLRADIGEIRHPELIRSRSREVPVHQVRCGTRLPVPPGEPGLPVPPARPLNSRFPHQSAHTLRARPFPSSSQFGMQTRSTVNSPVLVPDLHDLFPKRLVLASPVRGRTLQPGVVPTGGETQHAAHHPNRKLGPVRLYELESFPGIESLSRANQAAAFFRMSRSIRRRLISRLA